MFIRVSQYAATGDVFNISLRCPTCRQMGSFESLPRLNDLQLAEGGIAKFRAGQRRCPNPQCWAHVFFIHDYSSQTVSASYPAQRMRHTGGIRDGGIRDVATLSDSRLKTPGVSPGLKASPAVGWAGAAGPDF